MSLQSPSSSSSFPNEYFTYQVFLNFRGIDTRYGFANNLYRALEDKGIHTFIGYNDLQRGDEITPTLIKTIHDSRIYIPIFSINYASSSFCLDELVRIIHRVKEKGRLVLPVFYGVDPSDVRHQNGSYYKALTEHEKKFQNNEKNMERLYQWKIALNQTANISGYHINIGSDMNEYEHTFIGNIVQVVSNKINRAPLHVVDYPVGLESRVSKVNSLLNEACKDGVCMIGIHGTGGIGKSTLARAVYNLIADQFECLCFLHDVRENSAKHGLEHLQEQLLYKTIRLEMKIGGVNEGIGIIKERLHHKKVLLILDDVDKLKQLNFLAGGLDWFGPNSRVIVTTRDKSLLIRHGIERIYEVDGFDKGESLKLFMWMAFKTKKVDSINDDIVNRATSYASGLPFAIDVIGSNLSGTPIAEWESILDKYKRIPPNDIQNILQVSFDGLDEEQKNLFLDIACFFKWFHLEKIHAHYGHCIKHDVGVLVDKSLTKIEQSGVVRLHDLIEDMGKEIVRKESPDHPEKRTRLWFHKDIVEVLEQNKGTSKTKMIYLDCPSKEVEFVNMKVLKLDNCEYLAKIPNVSHLPNLEEFSFLNCKNLITIDNSIGFLSKLEILYAAGCPKLKSFPPLKLPSLKSLELSNCDSLQNFPEILDEINKLEKIYIVRTSIREIPVSFQNLIGLSTVSIEIESCRKLMFPSFIICNMPNVEVVELKRSNLSLCLPIVIKWLANMRMLDLSGSDFRVLPECLKECTSLRELLLDECHSLEDICAIPPNLQRLSASNCTSLNSSSKSMLMNKKLHESGGTDFCFPSAEDEMIPEWFNHQSRKTEGDEWDEKMYWHYYSAVHQSRAEAFPFWFRNKFPLIMIFFTNSKTKCEIHHSDPPLELSLTLFINDVKRNVEFIATFVPLEMPPSHTCLFNLKLNLQQEIEFHDLLSGPELEKEIEQEKEWIYAKIRCRNRCMDTFHLYFKEENNVDNFRLTNPYEKRKLSYLSLSQQCYQPLPKKQRLLDMEDLDTELVEELQNRMSLLSL
ncbi:disease resistance protein RUN1 [Trifolium repens]|nr:disease resistance protein RUN1 [Trifolium repens]